MTPLLASCVRAPAPPQKTSASSSSSGESWGATLRKWWEAAQAPAKKTATAPATNADGSGESARVTVDIAAVASRLPSWKLANSLDRSRAETIRLDAVPGVAVGERSTLPAPSFDIDLTPRPAPSLPPPASGLSTPFVAPPAETNLHEEESTQSAQGLSAFDSQARDQQEGSIESFLQAVTDRQRAARGDLRDVLAQALEEEVEAARDLPPMPWTPTLPGSDIQLEMTNLRLQLLRNVYTTPEQRIKSRDRLDELQAQWSQLLRSQEQARLQELKRLREVEPARLRDAGIMRLISQIDAIRRQQELARKSVLLQLRMHLAQDFGSVQTPLAITLDTSDSKDSNINTKPLAKILAENFGFLETNPDSSASDSPLPPIGTVGKDARLPQRPAASATKGVVQIQKGNARAKELRRQAWKEAKRLIEMTARTNNWQWQSKAQAKTQLESEGVAAPDRTPEVLASLFG